MRSTHVRDWAFTTSVIAFGIGLAVVPTASAEPNGPADPAPPPAPGPAAPAFDPAMPVEPMSGDGGDPAATACATFAAALDHAASNYSDYASALADPSFGPEWNQSTNVTGRTGLRQAAAATLTAAGTPGLQPDIADPMRTWSLNATKLLVLMAVNAPMDAINATANDLNTNAESAQMGCAAAGTHA